MILELRIQVARLRIRWHLYWFQWNLRRAAVHIARADLIDWRVSRAFGELVVLETER